MRWLYHVRPRAPLTDAYVGPAFAEHGFTHCSYADRILESAALYFPGHDDLELLKIDPRRLDAPIDVAATPRGPMPHVQGPIERDAVREVIALPPEGPLDDEVRGTRFCFLAFDGMTLLDLVGVHDPVRRIETMGFDPTSSRRIVGATSRTVYTADGATLTVEEILPPLDDVDCLVLPGGPETRSLQTNAEVLAWIRSFPPNRMLATVCTGALLAGAAGRLEGRRATTHRSTFDDLRGYGAEVLTERVVVDGAVVTAGGVTSGIDLGLWIVERLCGADARDRVADRMEVSASPR